MNGFYLNENNESIYVGILISLLQLSTWSVFRYYKRYKAMEEAYWGERRGRTRVEQEMRNLAQVQLNTSEGFFVQPIGRIESCYKQCIGTPRQGQLVPSSRSIAHLTPNMSPESLDGLEQFSHVWLTFQFHMNTNVLKEAKAFSGVQDSNKRFTFTAKITPPMLKKKVGVLSTRSPHRPNPIGVTLAKIERVDKKKRCIFLSACDLVDGTPLLDIKPYVPQYDSLVECRVPDWISDTIGTRNEVVLKSGLKEKSIRLIQSKCKLYQKDVDAFWAGVIETLEADVRSKFQTKRAITDSEKGIIRLLPFDELVIRYEWKEVRTIEISDVYTKEETEQQKLQILPTIEGDGNEEEEDSTSSS